MKRRNLFAALCGLLLTPFAMAQDAITSGGVAKVCSGRSVKCPLGHETCRQIDASIIVGNGNRDAPDWGQLATTKMLRCETCGVLFAEMW